MTVLMGNRLELPRCPHCGIAAPNLVRLAVQATQPANGGHASIWAVFICQSCGSFVSARADRMFAEMRLAIATVQNPLIPLHAEVVYPNDARIADELPEQARTYFQQAVDSLHAPDAAVMVAASAVDAMLKDRGLLKGTLNSRIDQAVAAGWLTQGMAEWAHQVRLDANDPRHADLANPHHDFASAERAVDFVRALGEVLFVLPARVTRGLKAASAAAADPSPEASARHPAQVTLRRP